jgi:hypothetical protein
MNMSKLAIGADDKKKLVALGGLVVVVILVMLYLFVFRKGTSPATTTQIPNSPSLQGPMDAAGAPGAPAAADASAPAGGGAGGNVTAVSLASLSGPRTDPFTPQYIVPPPPPPPPVSLPMPEPLPSPQANYAVGLPPAYVAGNNPSTALVGLPPIMIPRLEHAPSKPQQFQAPKQVGGTPLATPSFNKRLSGVIIGDSVHALLEISNASGTQTYVVQPGDTVAGIRILGIQRVEVGGRTVPRMLINENGEEKYVELRPAFNPQTDQQPGGGMGPEGLPGVPGAYPGNPTIFPAPSVRPGQQVGRGANPFSAN